MLKRTKIVIVILVAVIMALRGVYIVTRFSAVTRYYAFTPRIFYIDPDDISSVWIRSFYEEKLRTVKLYDRTDVEKYVDQMNNMPCVAIFAEPPFFDGGWEYYIYLETTDGDLYAFELGGRRELIVNGIIYRIPSDYFAELCEIGDRGPAEP